ncbi:MAG: phenylacetate--CoA ligase family protein, partial [Alphaproteobacteria bacterium]|nr:phenylacetate--CoA ligase family protein [Alphaproteobacteria bacterium]
MNWEEKSLLFGALERAMQNSPFWRSRMAELGVLSGHLTQDFPYHEVPLISKLDLLQDQAAHPP